MILIEGSCVKVALNKLAAAEKTMPIYAKERLEATPFPMPQESPLTIVVNGEKLVTLMCTPENLNYLVAGYLYLEGIIDNIGALTVLGTCDEHVMAQVRTKHPVNLEEFRRERTISSGCGGGIVAGRKKLEPVCRLDKTIKVQHIAGLMKELFAASKHYHASGGIHAAGLSLDGEHVEMVAEDVGRHNTIDKLAGECLLKGISPAGGVLVTTGRISSEMVAKAARMRVPVVASRSSPTSLAYELAQELGITLIGYVRANKLRIYTQYLAVV